MTSSPTIPDITRGAAASGWSRLRLRRTAHLRDLLAETSFSVAQLIQPVFVVEGLTGRELIPERLT